jgi:hypothetical protein
VRPADLGEHLEARPPRHRHVEHEEIGARAPDRTRGTVCVAALRDHRPAGHALQDQSDARADDSMVVGEDDAQRGRVVYRSVGGDEQRVGHH